MRTMFVFLAACASTPAVAPVAAPTPTAVVVSEPRCPSYARVVFVERGGSDGTRSVALHCGRDGRAELHEFRGMADEEGYADMLPLGREEAGRIWDAVRAANWQHWTSCDGGEGVVWEVEVDDGRQQRLAHCNGRLPEPWTRALRALEAVISQPVDWNDFNGDYWEDELGYYRSSK